MTADQVYEQTIKPLSRGEKLTIARLILTDIDPELNSTPHGESGFDYLKRLLPSIERITFTDQELAGVVLSGLPPR